MRPLVVVLVFIVLVLSTVASDANADPLVGANRQRIGNYDFEMTTQPKNLDAGKQGTIMLRFAGVNGDDLVDVPITVRIVDDGKEIFRTNPIVVPYGHHNFEYTFAKPGRYALYVELNDYAYSGETLTFTFPINAAGPADYVSQMAPAVGAIAAAAIGVAIVIRKRKLAIR